MNTNRSETIQTATIATAMKIMDSTGCTVEQATETLISNMIAMNPALAARLLASIA
jgi:hypothetical protein